ncbi:hypothetical protein CRUP_020019 [Coryphaenoides rupestris]|nr:hypothetical protein CRUP_020019 [Coryphaenoides rupestris]
MRQSRRGEALLVFKKSSPNCKLTVYLGKRDFVDHLDQVDPVGWRWGEFSGSRVDVGRVLWEPGVVVGRVLWELELDVGRVLWEQSGLWGEFSGGQGGCGESSLGVGWMWGEFSG